MNGFPTILMLAGLRVFLPVLVLLVIGTVIERRQHAGKARGRR